MSDGQLIETDLYGTVKRQTGRGRPPTMWIDSINDWIGFNFVYMGVYKLGDPGTKVPQWGPGMEPGGSLSQSPQKPMTNK